MIVRNESHVLDGTLRSARPVIDHWIVCDTGSTDATPLVVLQELNGIHGELHRTEWVKLRG